MFKHCGRVFKPSEVWFLENTNICINRTLYIGTCPNCQRLMTTLVETDIKSDRIFAKTKQGKKALKEIELCKSQKLFTDADIAVRKGKPCGWVFGVNSERKTKDGVKIVQKSCDFFGQSEQIKIIKV